MGSDRFRSEFYDPRSSTVLCLVHRLSLVNTIFFFVKVFANNVDAFSFGGQSSINQAATILDVLKFLSRQYQIFAFLLYQTVPERVLLSSVRLLIYFHNPETRGGRIRPQHSRPSKWTRTECKGNQQTLASWTLGITIFS